MSIADRIKIKREELGLTQADLARKSGLKAPGISQYESGLRNPSYEALIKLSNALGVSTDYLVSGYGIQGAVEQEKTATVLNLIINSMTIEHREKLLDYATYIYNAQPIKPNYPILSSAAEYGDYVYKNFVNGMLPVDVRKLAEDLNVTIIEDDLNGEAEGLFIRSQAKTVIIIEKTVTHHQRRQFIIGCLLGHLIIPWHLKNIYMIRQKGISSLKTTDAEEIEAQKFASYLLMPTDEVFRFINNDKISLKELKTIAYEKFDVSLFVLINQLVDIDKNRFTVIQSKNYEISKSYQGNRAIVENVHNNSFAYSFFVNPPLEEEFRGGEIPAEYWFMDAAPDEMLYEESVCNPEYNSVLTLLITR